MMEGRGAETSMRSMGEEQNEEGEEDEQAEQEMTGRSPYVNTSELRGETVEAADEGKKLFKREEKERKAKKEPKSAGTSGRAHARGRAFLKRSLCPSTC